MYTTNFDTLIHTNMQNPNPNNAQEQQTFNIQIPTAENIASRRPLIPISFAIAIILFFFTFCDFKCGGQKLGSVTGINLVTGTKLINHNMMTGRETEGQEIPASLWAIFAFAAAIIGLGAFLINEKRETIIGTGAGAIGTGAMIILQFVIKEAIRKQGNGQIEADFQFPYWGALVALGIAGLMSYLRMRQTYNFVVNYSPPSTYESSEESKPQTQLQSFNQPIKQTVGIGISKWLKNNSKKIIWLIFSIVILCIACFFFFKYKSENNVITFYNGGIEKFLNGILKTDESKIETHSNSQQIATTGNSLVYLKSYENKYPSVFHLFEKDPLKSRLQKLLGNKLSLFTKNMKTETPILFDGQNIFTSGCYPYSCSSNKSAIAIDTKNNLIFIGIVSSNKLQTFYENNKAIVPSKFKKWINNFKHSPTVDQNIASKYAALGTITDLDFQGNNYLTISITTTNTSTVSVWCTARGTMVFKNNNKTFWTDLTQGIKIGVYGKWVEMEGNMQLNAERIDIL